MRKVEYKMLESLRDTDLGLFKVSSNTTVTNCFAYTKVELHNNRIALIGWDSVQLYSCGWHTPTTKSRLNAICGEFNIPRIVQKKGVWYHTDGTTIIPFEEGGRWSRL